MTERNPDLINNLLKALAFQLGNEVSMTELANLLEVDKETVQRYIELLEKAFVIHRLAPLSRNRRNEVGKFKKIYFRSRKNFKAPSDVYISARFGSSPLAASIAVLASLIISFWEAVENRLWIIFSLAMAA